ncbi:MAG: 30S ribosomal protein S17 [Candidatus Pacebacteria bacterium]|nr:30S ribosomal protein S17 [Candidatus Paceibacterota bacterium]
MEKNKSAKQTVSEKESKQAVLRRLSGVVFSSKNDKTIVVKVESTKIHPKYKKRYSLVKKYKVHDEKNQYQEGDKVDFVQCRPLSKDKKWRALY